MKRHRWSYRGREATDVERSVMLTAHPSATRIYAHVVCERCGAGRIVADVPSQYAARGDKAVMIDVRDGVVVRECSPC